MGEDRSGELLLEDLDQCGVEHHTVAVGTTGTIVVLVDATGERSFLTDRGAAVELASVPADALSNVDLLHIPAYSFTEGPLAETSEQMVAMAVDLEIPISISTSSVAALRQYGRERFVELLSVIEPKYLIANHDEYSYLMQGHPWVKEADATVITNGARAAIVRRADGTEVRAVPGTTQAQDTTGAGDAFAGGFLVAQIRGDDLETSLHYGHTIASRTLDQAGARLGQNHR